ncbi:MAG: HAMP domain-containing sensor histidine kinase, partial [Pseudomonadota bacterium]
MNQLDSQNLEQIQLIKTKFLIRLIFVSAGIAFVFTNYFFFLLKINSVAALELVFCALFLTHAFALKNQWILFQPSVHVWFSCVTLLLVSSSWVSGGMAAPGIFWLPAIVYSASVLLDKRSTYIWAGLVGLILTSMLGLYIFGYEYPNFQKEAGRSVSHFMNASMILVYVSAFSLLSIRLRSVVDKLNHKILTDLYNENRLKSISQVVGGLGHEINNPLAIGYISLSQLKQWLANEYKAEGDDKMNGLLRNLESTHSRIAEIVLQLKQFNNKEKHTESAFNFVEVIESTMTFMGNSLRQEGIHLSKQVEVKEFTVFGNRGQLQQVLLNIFKNAIDAMENS